MIRLLIVAEVRLYRDGLSDTFARADGFEIVGTAATAEEALEQALALEPDVALVDLGVGENGSGVRALAESGAGVRVLALGVREVEADVVALAESGVAGYVTRDESLEQLVAAVRSVAVGETLCSPWVAATLLRRVAQLAGERPRREETARLTTREREIVALIDDGLSNKAIAERLSIELATVKNHVHNILEKLQVRRRAEAPPALASNLYATTRPRGN